jgi:hypothetical protein
VNPGALQPRAVSDRKQLVLRIDPAVHDALAQWAADESRSLNAQVETLLRCALDDAGRMPARVGSMPRCGRPPTAEASSGERRP